MRAVPPNRRPHHPSLLRSRSTNPTGTGFLPIVTEKSPSMTDAHSVPDLPGVDDEGSVDLVRFEEYLHVSTVSVPRERLRLQKVIVTEERTITVAVRREELRITREPLVENEDDGLRDNAAGTPDLDIVLHEEEILITTEVVPVERVRVRVSTVVGDLQVTDDVEKERVEVTTTSQEPRSVDGPQIS